MSGLFGADPACSTVVVADRARRRAPGHDGAASATTRSGPSSRSSSGSRDRARGRAAPRPAPSWPASRRSAAADGGALYREHCAVCHGVEGRGDGPAPGCSRRARATSRRALQVPVDADRPACRRSRTSATDDSPRAARHQHAGVRRSPRARRDRGARAPRPRPRAGALAARGASAAGGPAAACRSRRARRPDGAGALYAGAGCGRVPRGGRARQRMVAAARGPRGRSRPATRPHRAVDLPGRKRRGGDRPAHPHRASTAPRCPRTRTR